MRCYCGYILGEMNFQIFENGDGSTDIRKHSPSMVPERSSRTARAAAVPTRCWVVLMLLRVTTMPMRG